MLKRIKNAIIEIICHILLFYQEAFRLSWRSGAPVRDEPVLVADSDRGAHSALRGAFPARVRPHEAAAARELRAPQSHGLPTGDRSEHGG